MFERIESTIHEIRATLINSDKIRQLVYHDSNAALTMAPPSVNDVQQYIVTQPIFDMCETKDYDVNTLIQVELDTTDFDENSIGGVLRVNIVSNAAKWDLINNKIRPLQIADEVVRLIDQKKFSVSNTLEFSSLVPLIINKTITGYTLLFNFVDGSGNIINF